MASVTPAHILYPAFDPNGTQLTIDQQQRIDFHTVVSESHNARAEITKYPVQTGFRVSNNSIRENRVVTIEGVITNTSIKYQGTEQTFGVPESENRGHRGKYRNYGIKATNSVFQEIEELIIKGTMCRVITNLGDYLPVVFNSFTTKQMEGKVDSMHFQLGGEEIIYVDANTEGGSVPMVFGPVLTGAERDAKLLEMLQANIAVDGCSEFTEASVTAGQNFHINAVNASGQDVRTDYEYVGRDSSTGEYLYQEIVSPTTLFQFGTTEVSREDPGKCEEESVASSIKNKAMQAADCFINEGAAIIEEAVVDAIDSAIGKVVADVRGAFYDAVGFNNGVTSALASAGVGCLVRSVTGGTNPGSYQVGESLPTGQQIFDGASDFITGKPPVITLTNIVCSCEDGEVEVIDLSTQAQG